jgi:GDP-L-fucose synthase
MSKRILITGGSGMLGSAIAAQLARTSRYDIYAVSSKMYDLRQQDDVIRMFNDIKPEIVFHCAATVGGIWANATMKGKFFYENIMMNTMVFEAAKNAGVKRLVAMGSGCMYPRKPPVPTPEDCLWNGPPEKTNEPYAIAKRALVTQSEAYREQYGFSSAVAVLSNLYGPRDNFHPDDSHVVPALIKKFVEAKQQCKDVSIWGTGNITRDFLYITDAAEAVVAVANSDIEGPVNVGSGIETSLLGVIEEIKHATGFSGEITFDSSKPDGEKNKVLDIGKLHERTGFYPHVSLQEGIQETVDWYLVNQNSVRTEKR